MKRGDILTENIIFIILNLVFLSILFLFVFSKMGSPAIFEEKYSKQIALIIDAAKPGMEITLDMEDAVKSKDDNFAQNLVFIDNEKNLVLVKLRERGGYYYSFFNDVNVSIVEQEHNLLKKNKLVLEITDG